MIVRPRPPKGRFPKGNSRKARAERRARIIWYKADRDEATWKYGKLGAASPVRRIDPADWSPSESVKLTLRSSR